MSEKRFILCQDDLGNYEIRYEDKVFHFLWEVAPILNEQQATINELKAKLREKEEDERLYANEILELRETNKEHIKFKSLGGDY